MTQKARKRLFDVLRLAACVAALWIVIQGVTIADRIALRDGGDVVGRLVSMSGDVVIEVADGTHRTIPREQIAVDEQGALRITLGLATTWRNSTKSLLLLALLIHYPVILPQALRLCWMLRAQQIPLGLWESIKLSFAGNFLNFATPLGSNAGDVFKAYFLSLHTAHKTEAVTTVFLDRAVGLASILLVVAAITLLSPGDGPLAPLRPYMIGVAVAGMVAVAAYFAPPLRRLIPRQRLEAFRLFEHLRRMDNAVYALRRHKGIIVACVLITILLQAVAITAYFSVAVAMGLRAGWSNVLEYYTAFYTGVVVQALPGPPQGLGTVELTYRYFFDAFGSPSQIVCTAFGIRLLSLACALPGLLVTLTGAYKPREVPAVLPPAAAEAPSADVAPQRS
ncbi:MAG: flippase-like domain-containing protein [Planctomycetes bacterium]|nr:flippase-like domain-containing protein [Planctomycetota bacterium]